MLVLTYVVFFLATSAAEKDYQQLADNATWDWKPEEVTAFHSMLQVRCDFEIELAKPKNSFGHDLTIRFSDPEKRVYTVVYFWTTRMDGIRSPRYVRGTCFGLASDLREAISLLSKSGLANRTSTDDAELYFMAHRELGSVLEAKVHGLGGGSP